VSFFYIGDDASAEGARYGADVVVMIAGGELDFAASPQIRERLADHVDAGMRRIVLDLSMASFIDSTAIGALVGAVMSLRERGGGSLSVVCPETNRRVLRIFEITGVESLIAVHGSREGALSELALAG
jgi:anti-sigma B factor antagonist